MVRSAVWLTGSARAIVHHLKYGGWWRAASAMARVMRRLTPLGPDVTLIPIPLGAARRRARGYNQCDFLAKDLAREVGATVRTDVLVRTRDTKTQTGLTPEARRANLRRAFRSPRVRAGLSGQRVVLVDDVFTTGATMVAGAEALLDAGAAEVSAVTYARARRPLDDDLDALVHDAL